MGVTILLAEQGIVYQLCATLLILVSQLRILFTIPFEICIRLRYNAYNNNIIVQNNAQIMNFLQSVKTSCNTNTGRIA